MRRTQGPRLRSGGLRNIKPSGNTRGACSLCSTCDQPTRLAGRRGEHGKAMSIALAMLIAVQATPSASPACTRLMVEFFGNEDTFGVIDDVNQALLQADTDAAKATGDWASVARRRASNRAEAEDFRRSGDRIVALMAGQHCRLPDHVTSPSTFREARKVCEAAKGTPQESHACDYVLLAVQRALPQPAPPKRIRRR